MGSVLDALAAIRQLYRAGNGQLAVQQCQQLIQQVRDSEPSPAEAAEVFLFAGIMAQQMGQVEPAIAHYREGIQLNPAEPKLYNNLGAALKAIGQYAEAEAAYRAALERKAQYPEVYLNLGNLARQQNQFDRAITFYQQALEQQPNYADAFHSLGWIEQQRERYTEAIAYYRQAIDCAPNNPELPNALGNALQRAKQFESSIPFYERAIALRPDYPPYYSNLGAAYQELGQLDKSVSFYQQAIAIDPRHADAYYNLGNNFKAQDKLTQSVNAYRRAIAIQPDYAQAWNNLGLVLFELGNLPDSIAAYEQAIQLRSPYPDAHLNMGLSLLAAGDLARGFREYEWRWQVKGVNFKPARPFTQPQWDGSPLNGSTILLHAEQGFGDTIQLIRYVPLVVQRGGRVVVECQSALLSLLSSIPDIQLVARGEPLPDFQVHAPLMSLPYLLGTTLDTIPNSVPYLSAPLTAESLDALPTIRVGLVWSGSSGNLNDRLRSCGVSALLPLFELEGIQFVSLQKEVRSLDQDGVTQLVQSGKLTDPTDTLTDFADTAALIQTLDLVITVDTSVAHLAGALGKPVWILLTHSPDWRWLQFREDSPWYPSARLFRQTQRGEWGTVVQRIRRLLDAIVRSRQQSPIPPDDQEQAIRLMQAGNQVRTQDSAAAIHHYRQALAVNPQDYRIHNNLGVTLRQQGNLTDAIAAYSDAIALHPTFADAHYNLGNAWREVGDHMAAVYHYRRSLAAQPDSTNAWNNLGNSLKELGQVPAAAQAYEQAIALEPDHASAHHNLGYVQLLQGDLSVGFANYEWRWQVKNFKAPRHWSVPQWDGRSLLSDSDNPTTIVLHGEQGLGDAIQFCRYAQRVAELGGRVMLEVRQPLVRLLATAPGVAEVIDRDRPLPPVDVHAPLMSLPHILGTSLDTIPATVPYLFPPDDAPTLPTRDRPNSAPKVGLVWAGSPTHLNDHQRSIPLSLFRDVLDLPIQLYSLQKGDAAQQLEQLGNHSIIHLGDRLQDFADTAGAIAQLDLVITVDTAVAHLAGALGKPVWVLLPFAPDWRWLLDRADSPWYPTMRLFRQSAAGDWFGVMGNVTRSLSTEFNLTRPAIVQRSAPPAPMPPPPAVPNNAIAIGWQLNPATGWGIYGTNLALQLHRMGRTALPLLPPANNPATPFNPLHRSLLPSMFAQPPSIPPSGKLEAIVLRGLGNQFTTVPELEHLRGRLTVGVIFFEDTNLSPQALNIAKTYDLIVTGSHWNEAVLRDRGLTQVCTVLQGIDPTIFHPAPRAHWWGDRFVIFSGGKLEYRKGQDLVVRAFQKFRDRHPDALLLTAWHNAWPTTMKTLTTAGHVTRLPKVDRRGRLQIQSWLVTQGIPADAVIDVGPIPNHLVGQIIREADVALFPNRGEGGTNLAAMECLACGLRTILSANTGHLDLIGDHCYALHHQSPVRSPSSDYGVDGWGESDVDEILETLEAVYGDRPMAQQKGQSAAAFMQDWTWERQIQRLVRQLDTWDEP
jgi:tetratricopeptide (TPR) repeat protein/glycosyltransferase involved in cell wall biosynthesis